MFTASPHVGPTEKRVGKRVLDTPLAPAAKKARQAEDTPGTYKIMGKKTAVAKQKDGHTHVVMKSKINGAPGSRDYVCSIKNGDKVDVLDIESGHALVHVEGHIGYVKAENLANEKAGDDSGSA